MRKRYRLNLYSLYDHTGMEAYLTAQAARGWLLERMDRIFWVFRRTEPRQLTFAVTYDPDGSAYDTVPTEAQNDYRDMAARTGWRRLCTGAQLQVYCTAEPDPVPLETDPVTQVENLHDAAIAGFMLPRICQGGIGLINLGIVASLTRPDPQYFWQISGLPCITVLGALLLLQAVADLTVYGLWLRRAQRDADLGRFRPTPTLKHFTGAIQLLGLTVFAVYAAQDLFWNDPLHRRTIALVVGAMAAELAVVCGTWTVLRWRGTSRTVTRAVLLAAEVLLAVVLIAVIPLLA